MSNSKQTVNERISDELGLAPFDPTINPDVLSSEVVATGDATKDMENDLAIAREALRVLAQKGADLFEKASHFAGERQDPRSIEAAVVAQQQARESILAMIDFHKKRKEIEQMSVQAGGKSGDTTINQTTVFCGTTAEILAMLKPNRSELDDSSAPTIDV